MARVLNDADFSEMVEMISAAFIEDQIAAIEAEIANKVERGLKGEVSPDYLPGLCK